MSRRGENIYKRKDGRWEGRFLESYDPFGKPKYHSVYAKTYSEVKEKLGAHKKRNISPDTYKSLKLAKYCADWLETVKFRHKESTYGKYRNICQNHIIPELGGYNASLISVKQVENFLSVKLNTENLSPKTVNDILCVLKLVFSYVESQNVKTNCNFNNICVRQEQKQMRVLTLDEQKKLTEFLTEDMDLSKLGVYLSLFTGIRIGELCALKWKNIKLRNKVMHIDKTMQRIQVYDEEVKTKVVITSPKSRCSERDIPLPKFLCDVLKKFKSTENSFLLSGSSETFVEPRMMRYTFEKYMKICGLKGVNFHALRHTFATRCVESGFEIKTLSEILGHSSVKITLDKYVHSSMELKRKNMEKLVDII
ncbi:MAG: site-specific integrase [Clostridium sp.]|nr:site-specific integrase [Clostridium sp.]